MFRVNQILAIYFCLNACCVMWCDQIAEAQTEIISLMQLAEFMTENTAPMGNNECTDQDTK